MITPSAQATGFHIDRLAETVPIAGPSEGEHELLRPEPIVIGLSDIAPMIALGLLPNMQAHKWATPYGLGFSPNTRRMVPVPSEVDPRL